MQLMKGMGMTQEKQERKELRSITIDFESVRNVVKQYAKEGIDWKAIYPYRHLCYVLKEGGMRYKYIIEYIYSNYDEMKEIPVSFRPKNTELSKKVSLWLKKGYLDYEHVEALHNEIFGNSAKSVTVEKEQGASISAFGKTVESREEREKSAKVGEFLRILVSKKVIMEVEGVGAKRFYEENCDKYSMSELVDRYMRDETGKFEG